MTTTIELIFSGLMILSMPPEVGDPAVVVFPEDEGHYLSLSIVKGTTNCEGVVVAAIGEERSQRASSIGLVEGVLKVKFPDEDEGELRWNSDPVRRLPRSKPEATLISWLPRISDLVLFRSRLREPCDDPGSDCPGAQARFFLDRGWISSCHLVHDPADPGKVKLYGLPEAMTRAIADTVVVSHTLSHEEPLQLLRPEGSCDLMPDHEGNIVLLLSNAPVDDEEAPEHLADASAEHPESHFQLLHQFHDLAVQRRSTNQPTSMGDDGLADQLLGSCEVALKAADLAINSAWRGVRKNPTILRVHSPTECGTASQP